MKFNEFSIEFWYRPLSIEATIVPETCAAKTVRHIHESCVK